MLLYLNLKTIKRDKHKNNFPYIFTLYLPFFGCFLNIFLLYPLFPRILQVFANIIPLKSNIIILSAINQ